MLSVISALADLIRGLLLGRPLWGVLTLTVVLLTLTLLGITARVLLWLETVHSRGHT